MCLKRILYRMNSNTESYIRTLADISNLFRIINLSKHFGWI